MAAANVRIVLSRFAAVMAFALVFLLLVEVVQAQSNIIIKRTDNFSIPTLNGNVNFDLNGTYNQATLENATWVFSNLLANNSLLPLELKVSAENCNVTVTSCRWYNATIAVTVTNLRYVVEGQGTQTFRIAPLQQGGEWSVTFNASFIGENEGWVLSRDGTLTVTKAPSGSNVTLTYFVFPDSLGGNGNNSGLTFYQKHSVVIVTGFAAAITLSIAAAATVVSKNSKRKRIEKSTVARNVQQRLISEQFEERKE